MTTNNIRTFAFAICECDKSKDCDECGGTTYKLDAEEEAIIAHFWPPPAEQPEDPGSGVFLMDGKGRIKHIAA